MKPTAGTLPASDMDAPLLHTAQDDPFELLGSFFDRADSSPQPTAHISISTASPLLSALLSTGAAVPTRRAAKGSGVSETTELLLLRDAFWQLGPQHTSWLRVPQTAYWPLTYSLALPVRPLKPAPKTVLYERRIPQLDGQVFALRVVDAEDESDVKLFSDWQNSPRVADAWKQSGPLDEHRVYLRGLQDDAHVVPVFGSFDGVNAMYAELYWVAEDHLAPHVPNLNPFDRGIHVLVGSETHRGAGFLSAWAPSLAHLLFLWEPRTTHIFMEPRYSNTKIIRVMQRSCGFQHVKTFDFGHKRAALLELGREAFFRAAPFGVDGVGIVEKERRLEPEVVDPLDGSPGRRVDAAPSAETVALSAPISDAAGSGSKSGAA